MRAWDVRRAGAVPIVLLALVACSSGGAGDATPSPTGADRPATERVAAASSPAPPTLEDRNCDDFASFEDAQEFYIEAGGPDQDLHGLDADRNGNACDEPTPVPTPPTSSATVGTARPAIGGPVTPQPAAGPPKEVHSSTGAVDGHSGGSDSHSSCESSDETRCK